MNLKSLAGSVARPVAWTLFFLSSWACGPSGASIFQDGPTDDLFDAPLFTRYDARPRADARPVTDAPDRSVPDSPIITFPDADPGAVVTFDPSVIFVSEGGRTSVSLVLDRASASDTTITLTTSQGLASVPDSVVIPAGQTTATITVGGVTAGQDTLTADPGGRALIDVVPNVLSLDPESGASNVILGQDGVYTVTLDADTPADVPVTLTSDDPSILSTDKEVVVSAGQSTASFTVHGEAFGQTGLHAAIGSSSADATVVVNGLFLSEVYYDAPNDDDGQEWIELSNLTGQTLDMTQIQLWLAAHPPFALFASFSDTMAPGECAVYSLTGCGQDGCLTNGKQGDGIRLVTASGFILDEVIYGPNNLDGIPAADGSVPAQTDVPNSPSGESISRDFSTPGMPWFVSAQLTDGDCSNTQTQ